MAALCRRVPVEGTQASLRVDADSSALEASASESGGEPHRADHEPAGLGTANRRFTSQALIISTKVRTTTRASKAGIERFLSRARRFRLQPTSPSRVRKPARNDLH